MTGANCKTQDAIYYRINGERQEALLTFINFAFDDNKLTRSWLANSKSSQLRTCHPKRAMTKQYPRDLREAINSDLEIVSERQLDQAPRDVAQDG
jgi:hypothetical protein